MGKATDFPCRCILHSPHDIQITLFFNLDKSSQSVLVTEVNSQSWQISLCLPLLPDFYLHKIRMWHHLKKMCPHKISRWAKMHFPLCYFVLRGSSKEKKRKRKKKSSVLCKNPFFHFFFFFQNKTGNFTYVCHNLCWQTGLDVLDY